MILWTDKINILWINIYIANILYIIYIYIILYILYTIIYIYYIQLYIYIIYNYILYYIQLYIILYTNILYILQIYLLQININDLKSTWKGIKNLISLKELPNVFHPIFLIMVEV